MTLFGSYAGLLLGSPSCSRSYKKSLYVDDGVSLMELVSRVVLGPGLSKALNTSAVDLFSDCSTTKHPLAVVFLRNSAVTMISLSSLTLETVAL